MKKTFTYLIALLALMITSMGAMAQDGSSPLVNSTHTYSVNPGSSGNTFAWTIVEGTAGTDYTLGGTTSTTATITWKTTGTYTLQFRETATTGSCIALVTKSITVGANTFDVSTTSPAVACNDASGQANVPGTYSTAVSFTVTMSTGSSWSPNWEFTFGLAGTNGTLSNVKVDGTTQSGSGPYTITGITSTSGAKTVTVTCDITGTPTVAQSVVLTITAAKELQYNTPDKDTNDYLATQTINAIPGTSAITAN